MSAHNAQAAELRELLGALDRWLESKGHDSAHPWRASIARMMASTAPAQRQVLYRPCSFFYADSARPAMPRDAGALLHLAEQTRAVASGVADIMGMVEADTINADFSDGTTGEPLPALLSDNTRGHLTRLGIVALQLLAESAETAGEMICRDYPPAAPAGGAGQGDAA